MKAVKVLLLLLVLASVFQGRALAQEAPLLVPSISPIYVGSSDVPTSFEYYFYLANPSPYSAYVHPSFSSSQGVTLQVLGNGYKVPAFSVVAVPVMVNVTGHGDLYINYGLGTQEGTVYIKRLPLPVNEEVVTASLSVPVSALPGRQVSIYINFGSPYSSLTLYGNNASLSESGVELFGDTYLARGLPSSLMISEVEVNGSVHGAQFSVSVPVMVRVEGYTGDGFPMSLDYVKGIISQRGTESFSRVGPLSVAYAFTSNTTGYLILNFTKVPSEFWLAVNRKNPINITYEEGIMHGQLDSLEGWTHQGTLFFLAFNLTEPLTWDVGANGTLTGWLPARGGLSFNIKLGPAYELLIGIAVVLAVILLWAISSRKKGWPYSWD
ncbi:MAG: hypothetical protein ACP5GO_02360 [Thermoprotei archaeon]